MQKQNAWYYTYHFYLSTNSPNPMERQNPLDKILDGDCKAKENKNQ